ncbi:MAG: hypothetical protein IPK31_20780 [Chitinophagaceae bacterium]|nr:hypothetical protein [Chitinophagaceae bacterium]
MKNGCLYEVCNRSFDTRGVKEAETAIKEAMCLTQSLQTNYELASSVTGIGFIQQFTC